MTHPDDARATAEALLRLEGKVDLLASKVASGDAASAALVNTVSAELKHVTNALSDLKAQITSTSAQADRALSIVRVDLERQLASRTAEGERVHAALEKDMDALRETSGRVFTRLDRIDGAVNRLYGGVILAGALGIPGVIALIRALGH